MPEAAFSLDVIRVASPCDVSWDSMPGTRRVRFCPQCQQNVYNLSEMTRAQAEELVEEHEGRMCVRLYRRADGTAVTRDCSLGLRAARRGVKLVLGYTLFLVVAVLGLMFPFLFGRGDELPEDCEPLRTILHWLNPEYSGPVMGKM